MMVCERCNAENRDDGRYCRSCGAPLVTVCPKCGVPCAPDDRFCGSCGGPLALALENEPPMLVNPDAGSSSSGMIKQYTPEEIEVLLTLRRMLKKDQTTVKTLRQDDIDELFG